MLKNCSLPKTGSGHRMGTCQGLVKRQSNTCPPHSTPPDDSQHCVGSLLGGHCTMSQWFQITVTDGSRIWSCDSHDFSMTQAGFRFLPLHVSLPSEAQLPSPCLLSWLFDFLLVFFTVAAAFEYPYWFTFICRLWDSTVSPFSRPVMKVLNEIFISMYPWSTLVLAFLDSQTFCFLTSF